MGWLGYILAGIIVATCVTCLVCLIAQLISLFKDEWED